MTSQNLPQCHVPDSSAQSLDEAHGQVLLQDVTRQYPMKPPPHNSLNAFPCGQVDSDRPLVLSHHPQVRMSSESAGLSSVNRKEEGGKRITIGKPIHPPAKPMHYPPTRHLSACSHTDPQGKDTYWEFLCTSKEASPLKEGGHSSQLLHWVRAIFMQVLFSPSLHPENWKGTKHSITSLTGLFFVH